MQGETNECAHACLAMVLNHHGRYTSLADLRRQVQHSRPLALSELKTLAETEGMAGRSIACDMQHLNQLRLPAIMHVDFSHFVVLEKVTRRGARILDPAVGERFVDFEELHRRFTGIILELEPGVSFKPAGEMPRYSAGALISQIPLGTLARTLGLVLLLSICIQVFALATPFFGQVVIDEVLATGEVDLLLLITLAFGVIHLLSTITQWLRGLLAIRLSSQLSFRLSAWLFSHLLNLPIDFFSRRTIGDIISRFNSVMPIQDFITQSMVAILVDCLMVVTTFIALLAYSPWVFATVAVAFVLFFLVQLLCFRILRRRTHAMIIREAETQTHFIESLRTIETIRRFGAISQRSDEWLGRFVKSINAEINTGRAEIWFSLFRYLFTSVTLLFVVYVAAGETLGNTLTVGMLFTITAYTNHLTGACQSLAGSWQEYMMLSLHVQRMSDILETKPDTRQPLPLVTDAPSVRLVNVAYQHPGATADVLNGINIDLPAGSSLAITGRSGCGKSTLMRVIAGELSATQGEVFLASRLVTSAVSFEPMFSHITQHDQLLSGTLAENISLFDPVPDSERMVSAAMTACIHEEISTLPLGYETRVGEMGCELSAGQIQRVLIARALYRPAPVLLMDEGTSHLDGGVERDVMRGILQLEQSCIFITHRPEVAQLADQQLHLQEPMTEIPAAAS